VDLIYFDPPFNSLPRSRSQPSRDESRIDIFPSFFSRFRADFQFRLIFLFREGRE